MQTEVEVFDDAGGKEVTEIIMRFNTKKQSSFSFGTFETKPANKGKV